MFDIGWTELVVVACVAIIVVGPKDLPKMLRAFGKTMGNLRRMAGDFQRQFDDALKEAELDEVKQIATKKTFQPLEDVKNATREYEKKVRGELEQAKQEVKDAVDDPGAIADQGTPPKPSDPQKSEAAAVNKAAASKTSAQPQSAGKPAAAESASNRGEEGTAASGEEASKNA